MDRAQVCAAIPEILAAECGLELPKELDQEAPLSDLGIDSLARLSLLVGLEQRCRVLLPEAGFTAPQTLAEVTDAVLAALASAQSAPPT